MNRECLGKFGDKLGKDVWEAINSVFDVLPLAAIIDEQVSCFFVLHSTPTRIHGNDSHVDTTDESFFYSFHSVKTLFNSIHSCTAFILPDSR
jgi:hypothetical protein